MPTVPVVPHSGMTKSLLTVRIGASVTHVHDRVLAERWSAHLMASSVPVFTTMPAGASENGRSPTSVAATSQPAHHHDVHGQTRTSWASSTSTTGEQCHTEVQKCFGDAESAIHCDAEVQKCLGDAECDIYDDIPGYNDGLNIKGLDRNNMTRSSMKQTTLGQTKGLNKNTRTPWASSTSTTGVQCHTEVQKCRGDAESAIHCDAEVQKCFGDAECDIYNDIPGYNDGLNIKGLDRNNMTRSSIKHTTLGQTKGINKNNMLNAGLNSGSSSAGSTASCQAAIDEQVLQRLTVVEEAIRLQLRTGASHLQKIEMAPEAYGIPRSSRATVKKLRVDRNKALHVVGLNNVTECQNRYEGHDQKRVDNDNPDDKAGLNIKCLGSDSEVQKCIGDAECEECKAAWKCPNKDCGIAPDEANFEDGFEDDVASWGGPFCSECGHKLMFTTVGKMAIS